MSSPDLNGSRWLVITDDDRRGTIMVVAIICCIYCPMVLALRALGSVKNLGTNDFLATIATLTAVVEYIIVIFAILSGLGRTYDELGSQDGQVVGRLVMASEILYLTTLALTKCSVAMLCRRLFAINMKRSLLICDLATALCALWGLSAIVAIAVDCGPMGQIGLAVPFCYHLGDRWTGIAVTDTITEIVVFGLAVYVVAPLQVRFSRKAAVLGTFVPRLLIIILIGLNAQSVHRQVNSDHIGVELPNGTVYRQVQILYAIVTAALPALNRSLRLFHSSLGNSWMKTTNSLSQSVPRSSARGTNASQGRGSIILKVLGSSGNRDTAEVPEVHSIPTHEDASCLRPDPVGYKFSTSGDVAGTDADSKQSQDSTGSNSRIIRMETRWQVRHEEM